MKNAPDIADVPETDTPSAPRHPRRPDRSRNRILEAAILEFSEKGFAGGRVDEIAERAEIGKRMLYHYFGNKEKLFLAVIEKVYLDLWAAEAALELDRLPPREALAELVTFVWNYYLDHPEFITLLNEENLLKAQNFRHSRILREGAEHSQDLVEEVLARGVAEGVFRSGIDPVQLSLTITSVCYYYLTNHATSSIVYGRRLMTRKAQAERLAFNVESILTIVQAAPL